MFTAVAVGMAVIRTFLVFRRIILELGSKWPAEHPLSLFPNKHNPEGSETCTNSCSVDVFRMTLGFPVAALVRFTAQQSPISGHWITSLYKVPFCLPKILSVATEVEVQRVSIKWTIFSMSQCYSRKWLPISKFEQSFGVHSIKNYVFKIYLNFRLNLSRKDADNAEATVMAAIF